MSNKKWNIKVKKWKDFRFNRHEMDRYEGTRLGIHRRWVSKSGPTSGGQRLGRTEPERKYLIGLLRKFVGRGIDEFIKEYNHKTKDLPSIDSLGYTRFLDVGDQHVKDLPSYRTMDEDSQVLRPYGGKRPFWVDSSGIIRERDLDLGCTNKKGFGKMRIQYNQRLWIPKFGQVRVTPWKGGTYMCEPQNYKPEYREPVYFFDAFARVGSVIKKFPVYGCGTIDYYNYHAYCLGKEATGRGFYDPEVGGTGYCYGYRTNSTKAIRIEEEWIGVEVLGVKTSHHHQTIIENPEYVELQGKLLSSAPKERKEIQKRLRMLKPEIKVDYGMGTVYYFIKRQDYEEQSR